MLSNFLQDLRYGLRNLAAKPLFALVAVLSLALGLGVNTAIYSLFHQVAMRPLPVSQPEQLVNLSSPGPKHGSTSSNDSGRREHIFSYPMFRDLEREQSVFEGLAAHRSLNANVAYRNRTASGHAFLVSGAYFSTLRMTPVLGRLLGPQDDGAIGAAPVAVLSHSYWHNTLGGASDVVGQTLRINGESLTIVGVAPAGFSGTTFGVKPQVFVPITQRWLLERRQQDDAADRQNYWVYLFARLKPGVTLEEAQTALNGPYQRIVNQIEAPLHSFLDETGMAEFKAKQLVLLPGARGQSSAPEQAATPLALLLAAAALVLLIACLNLANLLLARGAARAGEFAVRASIGASRSRLVRQLLAEAAVLAALGALVSLPMAAAVLSLVGKLIPVAGAGAFELRLDATALRFAALAAMATVGVFGLFPAWQLARTEPVTVLRGESGGGGGTRTAARFRAVLAIAQIAFSMASLTLAGLFLSSLSNLGRVDLGMQVERVAAFTVSPERGGYTSEQAAAIYDRLEGALTALPGVDAATSSMVPLLTQSEWGQNISLKGFEDARSDDMSLSYNSVGTNYFKALSIPLLAGRDFELADRLGAPPVAIVNRAFVKRFNLGPNPVGQRMALGERDELDIEIVGLVDDSRYSEVKGEMPAQFFLPRRQRQAGTMAFYVRTAQDPTKLLPQLAATVASIDPDLPVENLSTLPQQRDQLLEVDRFVSTLTAAFAVLATLLAALGLYGVLSYTLAQRMRELGLRLALGAAPPRLRGMVMKQVGRLTLVGGLLGLAAALALGHAAQTLLFGLDGHDPAVLGTAALLLTAVAFGAGWLPARRAARLEPMLALRHE